MNTSFPKLDKHLSKKMCLQCQCQVYRFVLWKRSIHAHTYSVYFAIPRLFQVMLFVILIIWSKVTFEMPCICAFRILQYRNTTSVYDLDNLVIQPSVNKESAL